MPTYLYGLVLSRNAGRVPADVTGLDRSPVRVVVCDELAALVSTVDKAPARHDLESIAIHDRAASQVVRHATTVAASRFGQIFGDDTALCVELSSSQRLRATLERYDGFGEMRITMRQVSAPPTPERAPAAPQDSPGRAYLQSLREKLTPQAPVDLRPILGDLVLEERVERRKDLQTIAHLVRFDDAARYRLALRAHPALAGASVTGPHALYAFAEPRP